MGWRKGGDGVQFWAADCFTCQICNAFLWAGSWLNSGPWRSGRGSPKPGEFHTSCFGVPLASIGAVAHHLQTVGSHLPKDQGQKPNVTHLLQIDSLCVISYLPLFFFFFRCVYHYLWNSLSKLQKNPFFFNFFVKEHIILEEFVLKLLTKNKRKRDLVQEYLLNWCTLCCQKFGSSTLEFQSNFTRFIHD